MLWQAICTFSLLYCHWLVAVFLREKSGLRVYTDECELIGEEDKKLIRRWDSERELSLRRHCTHSKNTIDSCINSATDRLSSSSLKTMMTKVGLRCIHLQRKKTLAAVVETSRCAGGTTAPWFVAVRRQWRRQIRITTEAACFGPGKLLIETQSPISYAAIRLLAESQSQRDCLLVLRPMLAGLRLAVRKRVDPSTFAYRSRILLCGFTSTMPRNALLYVCLSVCLSVTCPLITRERKAKLYKNRNMTRDFLYA